MNRTTLKAAASTLWGPQYVSEMARQLNVSLRTAQRWNGGDSDIPQSTWEQLAELLLERKKQIDRVLAKLPVS